MLLLNHSRRLVRAVERLRRTIQDKTSRDHLQQLAGWKRGQMVRFEALS